MSEVKPIKIVAGLEADQTNFLLQVTLCTPLTLLLPVTVYPLHYSHDTNLRNISACSAAVMPILRLTFLLFFQKLAEAAKNVDNLDLADIASRVMPTSSPAILKLLLIVRHYFYESFQPDSDSTRSANRRVAMVVRRRIRGWRSRIKPPYERAAGPPHPRNRNHRSARRPPSLATAHQNR